VSAKQYKKSEIVQAIQFLNTEADHIQDIIDFVGLPISLDFTFEGVRLRVIRGAYDVIVAPLNNYIIKHSGGTLETCTPEEFDYEEVTV